MGQSQNQQPCTINLITQGYHGIHKPYICSLSTQINLFQKGEAFLSHSSYSLDLKQSDLLLENNRYYSQRIQINHPHLIALYFNDFIESKTGGSVKKQLGKYVNINSRGNQKANVNTLCSLNIFQQNCKKSMMSNFKQLQINLHLYHEYQNHTLEAQIERRKRRSENFRQKQIWNLMAHTVSAGKTLLHSGFKEPLLSPNAIKIDPRGQFKVAEWEFSHFYQHISDQDDDETYFYQEGQTFLKPQSSRVQSERNHHKKIFNVLTSYYWAPQGTSGMQNIVVLGHKQQNSSFVKKTANNQIFSLGMTLLHILLMRPLYQGETLSEKKINNYIKQAIEFRTSQKLYLSTQLINLIERMLSWDPEDRISYQQLYHQINSKRSTRTARSIFTNENEEVSSGTFREKRILSVKGPLQGSGSGSINQGFGDVDHPLEQSRKINNPNTIRSQSVNYQQIDFTIKRQRQEWQKFENRIEESSYKVKQNFTSCNRQLFSTSLLSFQAQIMMEDEQDSPNSQALCNYNTINLTQKQNIDHELQIACDIGGNSIQSSIKLLDISHIKAQDDTKQVSKSRESYIKLKALQINQQQSFNLFNERKTNSQVVREDSLLLKSSSIAPIPSAHPSLFDRQQDLFTPPQLLALIRSSALSAQSRMSVKNRQNAQQYEPCLGVSKQIQVELANSVFVKQSFAKGCYQGGKVEGLRSGYGTFYYNEGGKYCGDWQNNQMHGKGTLYYADGRIAYQGDWSHDSLSGKGILYNQNPIKLTRSFDYGCFDQSENCWVYYEGSFHNDDKWGKGTLLLSNGQRYQGHFRNDLIDGRGIFYTLGGYRIIGQWESNKLKRVIRQESIQKQINI